MSEMTKSQEEAIEKIRTQLDRRVKHCSAIRLSMCEVVEENDRYVYLAWLIRPTAAGLSDEAFTLMSEEALIRIGKRGGAAYSANTGYKPYRFDLESMYAAERAYKEYL